MKTHFFILKTAVTICSAAIFQACISGRLRERATDRRDVGEKTYKGI